MDLERSLMTSNTSCSRLKNRAERKGAVTMEYVMALGVLFPVAFALLRLLTIALTRLYSFSSATISWPFL